MPSIHDVSVHVVDSHGIQLEEWGIQHLRTKENQDKTSAYIKSESGLAFRIVIEAKIPYQHEDLFTEDPDKIYSHTDERSRRRRDHLEPLRSDTGRRRKYRSSPIRSSFTRSAPPPFDLLATLYLDGRDKAERRALIYLDPAYEDFLPGPGGQGARAVMKNRWVRGKDGNIYEHAWVFQDIGIETILDKLALTNSGPPFAEEDLMIDALNRAGIGHKDEFKQEENKKAGQIEVTITRVTIGRKTIDKNYRPKHWEDEKDDVDMEGVKSEVTHTTAFTSKGAVDSTRIPVISYEPYRGDDRPFAIFKFFYRSQEILEKYQFPGFKARESKVFRRRNHMDSSITNMTPLGILNGHVSKSKSKRCEGDASFEEQIKKGASKKESAPAYNFDDQNRMQASADAEESSQSEGDRPLRDLNRRRKGSRAIKIESTIKLEPTAENSILHSLPDYNTAIGSTTPSIKFPKREEKNLPKNSGKNLSLLSSDQQNGFATLTSSPFDSHDSCYGSADTTSPHRHNKHPTLETDGASSPEHPINTQPTKPTKPHDPSSFSVSKPTTLREDSSSDADDEQDPTSDAETLVSKSDMDFDDDDDSGKNADKDDEGLHKDLGRGLTMGKRPHEADMESDNEEGIGETKKYNTEEDQPLSADAGGESLSSGTWKQTPGKRVKVASGAGP